MDTIVNFLSDHSLWGLLIGIVAIFFIVSIVKSLLRITMTIAVIGLVMVVFLDFQPEEVIDKGKGLADAGKEVFEDNVKPILLDHFSLDDLFNQENGDTIVEFEELGVEYQLNDVFDRLNSEEELNELLDGLGDDEQKVLENIIEEQK